jgi:ElaB/YqjD/DUF883 family membrane-anchored ribosome-binding protein
VREIGEAHAIGRTMFVFGTYPAKHRFTQVEDDEMERNDSMSGMNAAGTGQSGMSGAAGSTGAGMGTGSLGGGATGGATSGAGDFGGSSVGSAAGSQGGSYGSDASLRDRAGNVASEAGDQLKSAKNAAADKLGTLKEKASNLSATLADRLEAGAEKLRQRGNTNQFAGVGGETVASDDQMAALTNRLAGGMQGTADMLRNGDLKGSIETQVRENPARTLLIAVGVGYLLGKALKK